MNEVQSTNHIFMVRPSVFFSNPETQDSNVFQARGANIAPEELLDRARREIDGFIAALLEAGVAVTQMQGHEDCPDHVFPCNWVTTHGDGTAILYPMLAPNRRIERTPEMRAFIERHYKVAHDFSPRENNGEFLEAAGSLCLDRVNRVAYMAISERSHEALAKDWAGAAGYELVAFHTIPQDGAPIYHTDLIMFAGTKTAGVCADCIVDDDRARVMEKITATHEVVELSLKQMNEMCGNALQVLGHGGRPYIAMSGRAFEALEEDQIAVFEKHVAGIVHAPIPTIETYGGGSARCMMLELF